MLDGLDDINWSDLRHAYGPATDVPVLIRDLLAGDPAVVNESLYALHSTIWHQGTVYEATPHAVPFLIELLEHDTDRAGILTLLEVIARDTRAPVAGKNGPIRATHRAARKGIPAFLHLLHAPDDIIRRNAAAVLVQFPEVAVKTASKLREAVEREHNALLKANLILDLGMLVGIRTDLPAPLQTGYTRFFQAMFRDEAHPLVRLAAAVAAARVAMTLLASTTSAVSPAPTSTRATKTKSASPPSTRACPPWEACPPSAPSRRSPARWR